MKRVKFYVNSPYTNCGREEIFEYEDDVKDSIIQEDFMLWIDEHAGWYELEDGEE